MKLQVWDNKGRERFVRAGQIIPAGWFIGNPPEEIKENQLVYIVTEEGNPYEQYSRANKYLAIKPLTE